MVCYEHAKAVHSTRAEPRSGPRQGAWYTFHKHWLATGVASMAKGGRPRLHLLTAAPPVSQAAPGSTHLRVGVALTLSHLPKANAPPLRPGPWRPMTLGQTVHGQSACARAEP